MADEVVEVTGDPQPLLDRGPPPGLLDAAALAADQHAEQRDHGRERGDEHEATRPWCTTWAAARTATVATVTAALSRVERRRSGPVVARVQITTHGAQGATIPSMSASPA